MSDDKTEKPTEHKLKQAREKGQVAKSHDVTVAVSTLAAVGALLVVGDGIVQRLRAVVAMALAFGPGELTEDAIYKRMAAMALQGLLAIAPMVAVATAAAVAGVAVQVGLQVSTEAVTPKFENLDPVAGLKRTFSLKSVMNFLQMALKAVVIGAVLWQAVVQLAPIISGAAFQSPAAIGSLAWSAALKVMLAGAAIFVVLAPLDFWVQKHFFTKQQRMSKDEVKREHKGQEGDPEIKAKRKELAHELAAQAPGQAVAKADAVIVNPTHYAVAIRYRADEVGVPVVLAKGLDDEALRIRALARALGVPVFAHPPLARALHQVPLDQPVPEALFEAVAVVLRWVEEIGARPAADTAPPTAPPAPTEPA